MKKAIFIILISVLFFPLIQEMFHIFNLRKLNGVVIESQKAKFTWANWFDGKFQSDYERYHSSNYGFRNLLIRIYNSLDYALFELPHASVVVGRNGYLYERDYLSEITGETFIGRDSVDKVIDQLSKVQKLLAEKNILLLTVFAPAKSYYYQEYIPEYSFKKLGRERNYEAMLNSSVKNGINLIDINGWFLKLKDTTRYPLFPKQGIHWNFYGMALGADTIVKYIENKTQQDLADVNYTLEHPDNLRDTDYDLGDLLNLQFGLPFNKMPYPVFKIDASNKNRPRIMVISDSFYWSVFNWSVFRDIFSDEQFLYYFNSIFIAGRDVKEKVSDYNLLSEVEKYDIILLMQSSPHYSNPGLGFIKSYLAARDTFEIRKSQAYSTFNDKNIELIIKNYSLRYKTSLPVAKNNIADSIALAEMNFISNQKIMMRNDPDWAAQIEKKAVERGTSIEEAIEYDARWVLNKYKEKK